MLSFCWILSLVKVIQFWRSHLKTGYQTLLKQRLTKSLLLNRNSTNRNVHMYTQKSPSTIKENIAFDCYFGLGTVCHENNTGCSAVGRIHHSTWLEELTPWNSIRTITDWFYCHLNQLPGLCLSCLWYITFCELPFLHFQHLVSLSSLLERLKLLIICYKLASKDLSQFIPAGPKQWMAIKCCSILW